MSRRKIFWELVKRTLRYNVVEFVIMALLGFGLWRGEHWVPVLVGGFIFTTIWVVVASLRESEEALEGGLSEGRVFISDFIAGVLIFSGLTFMVRHEVYYFWVMYGVAVVQNLRYTVLAWSILRVKSCHDES